MQLLIQRIAIAGAMIPALDAWQYGAILLVLFALVALPLGFASGFMQMNASELTWKRVGIVLVTSLFSPAVSEEVVFRVLLLPNPVEKVEPIAQSSWAVISLALFVVYHPANAHTFFPAGKQVFVNPIFLSLAALLGLVCTLAYFHDGSLWTPVFLHWIVVVVWLLLLGGYQKLHD
ncbi:MAG: CPBP family glutamic-type intramembrane protease [Kovacikia sp.]